MKTRSGMKFIGNDDETWEKFNAMRETLGLSPVIRTCESSPAQLEREVVASFGQQKLDEAKARLNNAVKN